MDSAALDGDGTRVAGGERGVAGRVGFLQRQRVAHAQVIESESAAGIGDQAVNRGAVPKQGDGGAGQGYLAWLVDVVAVAVHKDVPGHRALIGRGRGRGGWRARGRGRARRRIGGRGRRRGRRRHIDRMIFENGAIRAHSPAIVGVYHIKPQQVIGDRAGLGCPGIAAVDSPADDAAVANGPAHIVIHEANVIEINRCAAGLHRPVVARIGGAHDAAGLARNPAVVNTFEIYAEQVAAAARITADPAGAAVVTGHKGVVQRHAVDRRGRAETQVTNVDRHIGRGELPAIARIAGAEDETFLARGDRMGVVIALHKPKKAGVQTALAIVHILARPAAAAIGRVQQDAITPGHPAIVGVQREFDAAQPGWVQARAWILRRAAQLPPALAAIGRFQDLRVVAHDIGRVGIHRIHALQLGHGRGRRRAERPVAESVQNRMPGARQPKLGLRRRGQRVDRLRLTGRRPCPRAAAVGGQPGGALAASQPAALRRGKDNRLQRTRLVDVLRAPARAAVAGAQQRAAFAHGPAVLQAGERHIPQPLLAAAGLPRPGLPAIAGSHNGAQITHGPGVIAIYGKKAAQVERRVAGLQRPAAAAVGGAQHSAAFANGPADGGIQELHIHQAADGGRRLYGPGNTAIA